MATGETCEKRTLNAKLAQVAALVPILRVRVGKTSEARTHETGPKEREKLMEVKKIMAIPALCADRFVVAVGGNEATIAARTEKVTTKDAAPYSSGFFLPIRSRRRVMKLSYCDVGLVIGAQEKERLTRNW